MFQHTEHTICVKIRKTANQKYRASDGGIIFTDGAALPVGVTHLQSKRKIFLPTCPSDMHDIKFCCPKPKCSCPKRFAQNSKLKNNRAFNAFNHIISPLNCSWLISWYHAQSYVRNDPTNVFNRTVCQIPEPTGRRKNKWNGRRMAKLKGILNLISSSMRFTFMTNNINFNSTVIWSQFSTVAVLFVIKNELVPWTSHVKGLHVRTKFLPVPENRTQVLAHADLVWHPFVNPRFTGFVQAI